MRTLRQVPPRFVERVWGRTELAPFWGKQNRRIGEVWFELPDNYPLLIKFIFTDERLSIQVHPDDEYAAERESGSRGKTEMWHILAAESGATIALGFRERVTREQVRAAVANGSIESLVNLWPAEAGATFQTECHNIHAIGAGVSLCEIQQNSDITYRLYDYGRNRELHLEKGLDVLNLNPYDGRTRLPVQCPYYTTEALDASSAMLLTEPREHLLVVLQGAGTLAGQAYAAGEVWFVPSGSEGLELKPSSPTRLLSTHS